MNIGQGRAHPPISSDSLLEGRVTSEPVSEMGFFMNRELRSDSKTFMDDVGSLRVPFRGPDRPEFWFLSLGWLLRRCRFKVLKTLLFYPVSELALGEFPVYKRAVPTT